MPILAHLDDPPRPRWRGLLLGFALGLPITFALIWWLVPSLVGAVLGGARDLDSRLRAEDGYMKTLCAGTFDLQRDGNLCQCVLATDYPALDCRSTFQIWALHRQAEACAGAEAHRSALSFCTCVQTVANTPITESAEQGSGYERCTTLPDALGLPLVEELTAP